MTGSCGTLQLSILMVNWNTRNLTLECLRSVYRETRSTSFELILVDNGSEDGSVEAFRAEFPQVNLLAEDLNHGFAKGNNLAALEASGQYLLLLNTDTLVLDGAIDKLVAFAQRRPQAGIWGGVSLFKDGTVNPTYCWARISPWSSFCLATGLAALGRRTRVLNPEGVALWGGRHERIVDIVSGSFFLIERKLWMDLGGFDGTFFMYGEEADLCARAASRGVRPMITPDATIIHYGGASATRRANTTVYLSAARIGLARRHLSRIGGRFARLMTIAGAWWRLCLFRMASLLAPSRFAAAAAHWDEVWRRRQEWKDGPIGKDRLPVRAPPGSRTRHRKPGR